MFSKFKKKVFDFKLFDKKSIYWKINNFWNRHKLAFYLMKNTSSQSPGIQLNQEDIEIQSLLNMKVYQIKLLCWEKHTKKKFDKNESFYLKFGWQDQYSDADTREVDSLCQKQAKFAEFSLLLYFCVKNNKRSSKKWIKNSWSLRIRFVQNLWWKSDDTFYELFYLKYLISVKFFEGTTVPIIKLSNTSSKRPAKRVIHSVNARLCKLLYVGI